MNSINFNTSVSRALDRTAQHFLVDAYYAYDNGTIICNGNVDQQISEGLFEALYANITANLTIKIYEALNDEYPKF